MVKYVRLMSQYHHQEIRVQLQAKAKRILLQQQIQPNQIQELNTNLLQSSKFTARRREQEFFILINAVYFYLEEKAHFENFAST